MSLEPRQEAEAEVVSESCHSEQQIQSLECWTKLPFERTIYVETIALGLAVRSGVANGHFGPME